MTKTEKLKQATERIQAKVDEFKNNDVKPVYFNSWMKKLFAFKLEQISYRNRGENYRQKSVY